MYVTYTCNAHMHMQILSCWVTLDCAVGLCANSCPYPYSYCYPYPYFTLALMLALLKT